MDDTGTRLDGVDYSCETWTIMGEQVTDYVEAQELHAEEAAIEAAE